MDKPMHNLEAAKALARALMEDPLNGHERRIILDALWYAVDGSLPRRRLAEAMPSSGMEHQRRTSGRCMSHHSERGVGKTDAQHRGFVTSDTRD